jgi:hypothetical protein
MFNPVVLHPHVFHRDVSLLTLLFYISMKLVRSCCSSVSIVSDYRLDNRASGIGSPAEAEGFSSSLCVQTSSEAHPVSYPVGTFVLSSGVKRGRAVTLTTHLHLEPRLRMSRSYTSSLACCLHGGSGTVLRWRNLVCHPERKRGELVWGLRLSQRWNDDCGILSSKAELDVSSEDWEVHSFEILYYY